MKSLSEITHQISRLQADIAKLEAEKKELESMNYIQQLAWDWHSKKCHHNHTDGCGWYYFPTNDWTGSEKREYYDKANTLIGIMNGNVKMARKVLDIL